MKPESIMDSSKKESELHWKAASDKIQIEKLQEKSMSKTVEYVEKSTSIKKPVQNTLSSKSEQLIQEAEDSLQKIFEQK